MEIFEVKDKSNRLIRLHERQWKHIITEHPYMSNSLELIKQALVFPDKVGTSFSDSNVKLYYRHQKEVSKYLLVVVKYLNNHAFVIMSFYTRKLRKKDERQNESLL